MTSLRRAFSDHSDGGRAEVTAIYAVLIGVNLVVWAWAAAAFGDNPAALGTAFLAYVLGLRPTSPGFQTWIIQPQVGDLEFAQGQVGTPYGTLGSRWKLKAHHYFKFTVAVPKRTSGTVAVPLLGGKNRTIARDGTIVWQDGRPEPGVSARRKGGYVLFEESRPGVHTYAWAKRGKKK